MHKTNYIFSGMMFKITDRNLVRTTLHAFHVKIRYITGIKH